MMKFSDVIFDVGQPVAFYPGLAPVLGGVKECVFLCLIFWKTHEGLKDRWVQLSMEQIEKLTGMGRREQETARSNLRRIKVLEEKDVRLTHQFFYRVNLDVINELWASAHPGTAESAIPEGGNPPSGEGGNEHPSKDPLKKEVKEVRNKGRATLAEVQAFCQEIELPASDAEWFFYKCEGNGWKNGGKPILDWQATIRAWKAGGYLPSQKNGAKAPNNQPVGDTFWKDKARFDMVEKEIHAIEARASHTAMDIIVEPKDQESYKRLKAERRELKTKMKL